MVADASRPATTVRHWLAATIERFERAGLFFGHGSSNADDEAIYLLLHTLHLPLDDLDSVLDRPLSATEAQLLEKIARRRIEERIPAAYLTHEAWLGQYRFYVDERVSVPRSYTAELPGEEV